MKNTFVKKWSDANTPERQAFNIIHGMSLEQYQQYVPQFLRLHPLSVEDVNFPLRVLDFGCGLGRFLYHGGTRHPNWTLVGYDHPNMLKNISKVWELPANCTVTSDWDWVMTQKFDLINAEIVLMHVLEPDVRRYLEQFKTLLSGVDGQKRVPGQDHFLGFFHATRETLDDEKTNIWDLVFDCGWEIDHMYYGQTHTDSILSNAAAMLKVK